MIRIILSLLFLWITIFTYNYYTLVKTGSISENRLFILIKCTNFNMSFYVTWPLQFTSFPSIANSFHWKPWLKWNVYQIRPFRILQCRHQRMSVKMKYYLMKNSHWLWKWWGWSVFHKSISIIRSRECSGILWILKRKGNNKQTYKVKYLVHCGPQNGRTNIFWNNCLVIFRDRYPFKVYFPNKSGKYRLSSKHYFTISRTIFSFELYIHF